jgi:hypothetical protein
MKIYYGTVTNNPWPLMHILSRSAVESHIHTIQNAKCATDGLNLLLDGAEIEKADIAVLCHHDMYFKPGWSKRLGEKISELPTDWIIAGLYGINEHGEHCGNIHDRRVPFPLHTAHSFPQKAISIDACVMIFNVGKDFRFEQINGFDLYDTYACLRAKEMGGSAWIINCQAEHYCTRSPHWQPDYQFIKTIEWLQKRFPNDRIMSTCYGGGA